jgi:hypothetical protein
MSHVFFIPNRLIVIWIIIYQYSFQHSIKHCFVSDGWVPLDDWEATKVGNEAMFNGMLEAVLIDNDPDDDEPIRVSGYTRYSVVGFG